MINTQPTVADDRHARRAEAALRRIEAENHELRAILDTATDGVLVLDRAGRVLSANRSARRCSATTPAEFAELSSATCSRRKAAAPSLDYLDRLARDERPVLLDAGREADRARAAGRAGAALHDHGPHRRTARSCARCCATSPPGSAAKKN